MVKLTSQMQNLKISIAVEERGELKQKYTPLNFLCFAAPKAVFICKYLCVYFHRVIMFIQNNKCLGIHSYM